MLHSRPVPKRNKRAHIVICMYRSQSIYQFLIYQNRDKVACVFSLAIRRPVCLKSPGLNHISNIRLYSAVQFSSIGKIPQQEVTISADTSRLEGEERFWPGLDLSARLVLPFSWPPAPPPPPAGRTCSRPDEQTCGEVDTRARAG